jgi:hypothetical protein
MLLTLYSGYVQVLSGLNSVDQDQLAHATSDANLHCLLLDQKQPNELEKLTVKKRKYLINLKCNVKN